MNADKTIFDSSLPRHLFCMQFFSFVNSLAYTHSSFGVRFLVNKWTGFCFQIIDIFIRKKSIFLFINLEDPRILKVNTVIHDCYELFNVSMDTGELDTKSGSARI